MLKLSWVFFTQLKTLSSTTAFNIILAVHEENTKLQKQLKHRDEEISKLEKKNIIERDKNKEAAVNEMFEVNKKEKVRHKNTRGQVQALQKKLEDKGKIILQQNERVNELEEQLENVQSDCVKEGAHY